MRIKYARKVTFFMWLLYVQLLRGQKRNGLACAAMICPPELPIDEARNEAPRRY